MPSHVLFFFISVSLFSRYFFFCSPCSFSPSLSFLTLLSSPYHLFHLFLPPFSSSHFVFLFLSAFFSPIIMLLYLLSPIFQFFIFFFSHHTSCTPYPPLSSYMPCLSQPNFVLLCRLLEGLWRQVWGSIWPARQVCSRLGPRGEGGEAWEPERWERKGKGIGETHFTWLLLPVLFMPSSFLYSFKTLRCRKKKNQQDDTIRKQKNNLILQF